MASIDMFQGSIDAANDNSMIDSIIYKTSDIKIQYLYISKEFHSEVDLFYHVNINRQQFKIFFSYDV